MGHEPLFCAVVGAKKAHTTYRVGFDLGFQIWGFGKSSHCVNRDPKSTIRNASAVIGQCSDERHLQACARETAGYGFG
jgi:hypothetical protein